MNIVRRTAFILLALIATESALCGTQFHQEPAERVVLEGRNLKEYADGGEFSNVRPRQRDIHRVAVLRRFILHHWSHKARGHARLSLIGADSTATTYIFVEPDKAGAWRVACRRLIHGYPSLESRRWFLSDTMHATSLRWIHKGSGKILVLKDRKGEEILRL